MDPELIATDQPQPDPGRRGSKTGRYVAAGALVTGGVIVGALFSPVGLAGAQTSDDADSGGADSGGADSGGAEADGADSGDPGRGDGEGRGGHHHDLFGLRESADGLAELLGLSTEELFTQIRDGQSLSDIAEAQGVAIEDVTAYLLDGLETHLDEAVDAGRIDEERADEVRSEAEERIDELVDGALPLPGPGRAGRGGGFGLGGHGLGLGELAESLGLTADDIRSGLQQGQTPAEIAAGAGVSEDELIDAIVDHTTERLDQAVEDGRIDQDKADEILAGLKEKVSELVNTAPGDFGLRERFGQRGGPGNHRGGGSDGDPADHGSDDGPTADGTDDSSDAADEGETEGSSLTF